MHGNAVCVHFHVEPKYPDTVVFLNNFVKYMSEKIYVEKGRLDVPLRSVATAIYSKPSVKNTGNVQRVAHADTAVHSGFAVSRRSGAVLVQNNATTAHTVKADARENSDSSDESSYSFLLNASSRKISTQMPVPPQVDRPTTVVSPIRYSEGPGINSTGTASTAWTQSEIREFLHPGYPLEMMRNRPITLARTITPKELKSGIRFKFTPFSYCRYKEFYSHPTSPRFPGSPFIETERMQLQEAKRSKEKWLEGTGFKTVFRPLSRTDLSTPLETEPVSHVSRHQFRQVSKNKWRAGDFRK